MHFPDMQLCRYGPLDAVSWAVPFRAIGWLEHPHSFQTGVVPARLVPRLEELISQTVATFPEFGFLGLKTCSICRATGQESPGPVWSQENLIVPGAGEVYVAPSGIVHYVRDHGYMPPRRFIEAALDCPDCSSPNYLRALRDANGGLESPLERSLNPASAPRRAPPN
jgi:hypothetical protein